MELANRKVSKTFSMQNFKENQGVNGGALNGNSNANQDGASGVDMMKGGTGERNAALISSQKSELISHKMEDS